MVSGETNRGAPRQGQGEGGGWGVCVCVCVCVEGVLRSPVSQMPGHLPGTTLSLACMRLPFCHIAGNKKLFCCFYFSFSEPLIFAFIKNCFLSSKSYNESLSIKRFLLWGWLPIAHESKTNGEGS